MHPLTASLGMIANVLTRRPLVGAPSVSAGCGGIRLLELDVRPRSAGWAMTAPRDLDGALLQGGCTPWPAVLPARAHACSTAPLSAGWGWYALHPSQ
jgi:hypothetical protein